jgi:hypothetical protein
LGKLHTRRVHTDENLSDRLDVQVVSQLDHADVVVNDLPQSLEGGEHGIL